MTTTTRFIVLNGRRTSIKLEPPFWDLLQIIAADKALTWQELVRIIADDREPDMNVSQAIRCYCARFCLARLEERRAAWRPIESAPKNGKPILARLDWLPYPTILFWATYADEWRSPATEYPPEGVDRFEPTHWTELPSVQWNLPG